MRYLRIWIAFYAHPNSFAQLLLDARAPQWGFRAALQRACMDSLLLYLPLALLHKIPPEPSYLGLIPDDRYYAFLVGLCPLVLLAQWLIAGALVHLLLRLFQTHSDMDQILNVTGFVSLSIGSILLLWDWAWFFLGGLDQYTLGISHLIIDLWGVFVAATALRTILKTPLWLGVIVNLLAIAIALPIGIMFMRSPL